MYLHKDGLAYSSWQATVVGRKRWVLCPYTESKYLTTADLDVFGNRRFSIPLGCLHSARPTLCLTLLLLLLLHGDVSMAAPDYTSTSGQQFANAYCADVTVAAGELLYYPTYWWHQTRCLDTPTIGLTGDDATTTSKPNELFGYNHRHWHANYLFAPDTAFANHCHGHHLALAIGLLLGVELDRPDLPEHIR